MNKKREELEKEYAEVTAKLEQEQHKGQRLENRIMGEDGKVLFDAVPTTDWCDPATLEHWREAWAAMVNQ